MFNYLYDVIIEKQPEVVTLDDSDVVSTIGPAVKRRAKCIDHIRINNNNKYAER